MGNFWKDFGIEKTLLVQHNFLKILELEVTVDCHQVLKQLPMQPPQKAVNTVNLHYFQERYQPAWCIELHNHVTHLHTMLIRVKVEMVMLTRHDENYWSPYTDVFFFFCSVSTYFCHLNQFSTNVQPVLRVWDTCLSWGYYVFKRVANKPSRGYLLTLSVFMVTGCFCCFSKMPGC